MGMTASSVDARQSTQNFKGLQRVKAAILFLCLGTVFTCVLFSGPPLAYAAALQDLSFKVTASSETENDADVVTVSPGGTLYLSASADISALEIRFEGPSTVQYRAVGDRPWSSSVASEGKINIASFGAYDTEGNLYYPIEFRYVDDGKSVIVAVDIYKSEHIATMFVETSKGIDYLHASKENRDKDASMVLVEEDGKVSYDSDTVKPIEIKGRGNSTWKDCFKKPYQIKLDKKAELVDGAGKAKTWILLANAMEPTLIRNQLGYDLADQVGLAFSPLQRQIDLYIDGDYRGTYLLCEKTQIGETRVDIDDLEADNEEANEDVSFDDLATVTEVQRAQELGLRSYKYTEFASTPADITGGYLMEMELWYRYDEGRSGFVTANATNINLTSPEAANEEEVRYIAAFMQEAEDAIYSESGYNSKGKHYSEYIDVTSFAQFYLVQETLKCYDGFATSTFFYKERDTNGTVGKLYAGPVWDFDQILGNNALSNRENPEELWVGNAARGTGICKWASELMGHDEFKALVHDTYWSEFSLRLETLVDTGIDEYSASVAKSAAMNGVRWSVYDSVPIDPLISEGSLAADIDFLKTYLERRTTAIEADALIGTYELAAGYHAVSVDATALALGVTPLMDTVAEGSRATVRIDGAAFAGTLVARTSENVSTPLIPTDTQGIYAFAMPAGDVTIFYEAPEVATILSVSDQIQGNPSVRPSVTVLDKNGHVVPVENYDLHYDDTVATSVTVTATGKDGFGGTATTTYRIVETEGDQRIDMDACEVKLAVPDGGAIYNGTPQEPTVTLEYDDATVDPDAYTVEYYDHIATGEALVYISAKDDSLEYCGSMTTSFSIIAADLGDCQLEDIASTTHNGLTHAPRLNITDTQGSALVEGIDYVARYKNNISAGTATVAVTALGNYEGELSSSFRIEIKVLSLGECSIGLVKPQLFVAGQSIKPSVQIKLGGTTLVEGTDYVLYYRNNDQPGTASIGIKGINNYDGFLETEFRIVEISRLAGATRYETATTIAGAAYPQGANGVIVATGSNYPDALAASALAGLKDYPIVLTDKLVLSDAARQAIIDLGAQEAIIVGGSSVISQDIEEELMQTGNITTTRRLSGSDRWGTVSEIYKAGVGQWGDTAIIATAFGFADALSISPYAASQAAPVFLTDSNNELSKETLAELKAGGFENFIIVGGTGVVSPNVDSALDGIGTVERLGGADRYKTSALIAAWCIESDVADFSWSGCAFATGRDYPDALVGGVLQGANDSVLLLIDEGRTEEAFSSLSAREMTQAYLLGGTGAVPEGVENSLRELLLAS